MVHERSRLLALLRQNAVLHGDFVLSSGQHSAVYLDARRVTLSAEGSVLVGRVFLEALEGSGAEAVAGLTLGTDPIVAAITLLSGLDGFALDRLIVRKERKEHGAGRRIEGPWKPGVRVAVVDDTLTTGASSLSAARAIEEEGGQVCGVYALIDRGQGARQAIEGAGYAFQAIFTAADLTQTV